MAAIRAPRTERMFQVYRHDQSRKTNPHDVVDAATATYLLDCKFAKRLSKWQIVLAKPLPLQLRGPSANIRESTIIAAVSGSRYHQSLIQAWA